MTDRLELKAQITADATGEITGIAWPYGSADRIGDVIEKGAFNAPTSLPILWAHDQAQTIGIWDQIADTPEGLIVKGRLLIADVEKAREVHALIRAGAVTGLSVGFVTKTAKPRQRGRTITAADLHEVSVVAIPCHPGAQITTLKAERGTATPIDMKDNLQMEQEDQPAADPIPAVTPANDTPAIPAIDLKTFNAMKARLDALEAKAGRPGIIAPHSPVMGDDDRKAFVSYVRTGVMDQKTLNVGSATSGGVLAPEDTSKSILQQAAEFSPLRSLASVISMGGPLLQLPRLVDEIEVGERTELGAMSEDEPSFDQIDLKPFEMAVTVPVSRVLLEDAMIDVDAYLTGHIARRFGQKEAAWFIKGNGTSQAEGILTNTEIEEAEIANAAGLTDALIEAFYGVKTVYAARGAWLMNRATMAAVRKLRDADGAFIWQPGLAAGQPATLLGRPVYEAVDMPDPAAGNTFAIFADFNATYAIADRIGLSVLRDEYTGAANGIVKLHARRRVGGRVILPEAAIKLKFAA